MGDFHDPEAALEKSLKTLGLDYVDLYLIHWPEALTRESEDQPYKLDTTVNFVDAYKEMQKIYKNTKKTRSIGISNFTIDDYKTLFSDPEIDVVPVVNQIETHPFLPQEELKKFFEEKGVHIEAYSPLGSTGAPLSENETVINIAKKYNADAAKVLISWNVQRGNIVLPKSATESRLKSNIRTITLDKEDFDALNQISVKEGVRRINAPWFKKFND